MGQSSGGCKSKGCSPCGRGNDELTVEVDSKLREYSTAGLEEKDGSVGSPVSPIVEDKRLKDEVKRLSVRDAEMKLNSRGEVTWQEPNGLEVKELSLAKDDSTLKGSDHQEATAGTGEMISAEGCREEEHCVQQSKEQTPREPPEESKGPAPPSIEASASPRDDAKGHAGTQEQTVQNDGSLSPVKEETEAVMKNLSMLPNVGEVMQRRDVEEKQATAKQGLLEKKDDEHDKKTEGFLTKAVHRLSATLHHQQKGDTAALLDASAASTADSAAPVDSQLPATSPAEASPAAQSAAEVETAAAVPAEEAAEASPVPSGASAGNAANAVDAQRSGDTQEVAPVPSPPIRRSDAMKTEEPLNPSLVAFLQANGFSADVNCKRPSFLKSETPLHAAVALNDLSMVSALLEARANQEERDSFGDTSLTIALKLNHHEVAKRLQQESNSAESGVPMSRIESWRCKYEDEDDGYEAPSNARGSTRSRSSKATISDRMSATIAAGLRASAAKARDVISRAKSRASTLSRSSSPPPAPVPDHESDEEFFKRMSGVAASGSSTSAHAADTGRGSSELASRVSAASSVRGSVRGSTRVSVGSTVRGSIGGEGAEVAGRGSVGSSGRRSTTGSLAGSVRGSIRSNDEQQATSTDLQEPAPVARTSAGSRAARESRPSASADQVSRQSGAPLAVEAESEVAPLVEIIHDESEAPPVVAADSGSTSACAEPAGQDVQEPPGTRASTRSAPGRMSQAGTSAGTQTEAAVEPSFAPAAVEASES